MNFLNQEILLISFTWNCLVLDNSFYLVQAMKVLTLRIIKYKLLKVGNVIAEIA